MSVLNLLSSVREAFVDWRSREIGCRPIRISPMGAFAPIIILRPAGPVEPGSTTRR